MRFRASVRVERVVFNSDDVVVETRAIAKIASRRMKKRLRKSGSVSRPGQSPYSKTGRLRRSIGLKKIKSPGIGYRVGPRQGGPSGRDGFFGRFLEFGTKHLAKRSFVARVIKRMAPFAERRLSAVLAGSVRGEK